MQSAGVRRAWRFVAPLVGGAAALAVLLGGVVSPAVGQTGGGYPGPTTTRPPQPTREQQSAGQVRPGERITIESCGFQPASLTTVTFNSASAGTASADASGCAPVSFAVDADDCPQVEVNGFDMQADRGGNEVVVSGTGANTASREVATNVTVTCSRGGGGGNTAGQGPPDRGDRGVRAASTSDADGRGARELSFRMVAATRSALGRFVILEVLVVAVGVAVVVLERRRRRRLARL